MGVENEFQEDNFFRQTGRVISARVIAHLITPRVHELFGASSGQPQLFALTSQGWSNFTLAVSFARSKTEYILRLSERPASLDSTLCRSAPHFEKEYAILSHLQGLPFIPTLISNGIGSIKLEVPGRGEKIFAFMIQERMPFQAARDHTTLRDATRTLEQLGEVCQQIHTTTCHGFGMDFNASARRFNYSSFEEFVESKIRSIQQSPISYAMKRWLELRAEDLLAIRPEAKLFHRDLLGNPGNYLVDDAHNVRGIIDWEFAGSGAAFHYEIASMLYVLARDGHPTERIEHDLAAVLRGYGMPMSEYRDVYERDIETIVLMNSISAILKYAELKKNGTPEREPWRKVFAERADHACTISFINDAASKQNH